MSTNGRINSGNNAAMSLWNKFSDLQQQAEQCRAKRKAAEQSIESLRAAVEQLQQTATSERQLAATNTQKASRLHAQLTRASSTSSGSNGYDGATSGDGAGKRLFAEDDEAADQNLTLELEEAEKDYTAAVAAHENAKRQLEQWKAWKVDQLQYQQQPDFRRQCCEWRLQASAAGLSHAVTVAALKAVEASPEELEGLEEESEAMDVTAAVNESDDPSTWILSEDDYELREAVEAYQKSQQQHAFAVAELDTWKIKQAALQTKRQSRQDRKEQLEAQLQRLNKDCNDLQSETAQLKLLTEEDVVLAATYRTKISHRQSRPVATFHSARRINAPNNNHQTARRPMHSTVNLQRLIPPPAEARPHDNSGSSNNNSAAPTIVPRNPYASTAKRGLSQITPSTSATTTSTAAAAAATVTGNQRRDELMSIVLGRGISQTNNNSMTDEDETTSMSGGAHRWRHDRRFGCSVQVDETQATPSNNNDNNNTSAINLEEFLEDSDDDIDELLSFSAFSKRRS